MTEDSKHSTRVAIISAIVSLGLSVIFASYIIGQRTGKLLETEKWREETAPRIERMDAQGTLSQQYFIKTYSEEQAKQYERIKHLEEIASHQETINLRIDRLEQIVIDGQPKRERNP